MRTEPVTVLSDLPVLMGASAADQEGVVVPSNFLPPTPVRSFRPSDISEDSFSRSFRDVLAQPLRAEKQELVAIVGLIQTYKRRNDLAQEGKWKKTWNAALQAYEQSLAARKASSPLLEEREKRLEWGQQIIVLIAPACGIDLRDKSPEEAADMWDGYRLGREVKSDPRFLLCQIFSKHLSGVSLVLWFTRGRSLPALYCVDKRTAFYVRALLTLDDPKGFAVCRYPRCRKIFERSRIDQQCCCAKHRDAQRIADFRATPKGRRAMRRDAERRKKRNALVRKMKAKVR
jgi:hypothetical protein